MLTYGEPYMGVSLNGIDFVLTPGDPIVGIDIDHCIDKGGIQPTAEDVVQQLRSYTEISPSGMGLRDPLVASPGFAANMRRMNGSRRRCWSSSYRRLTNWHDHRTSFSYDLPVTGQAHSCRQ